MKQARNRLIFALDVPDLYEAERYLRILRDRVGLFKVGKELFTHAGPRVVEMIGEMGQRTFLDLKFHDIPNTVGGASREATRLNVAMFNVHAMGGPEMMAAAAEGARSAAGETGMEKPAVLAVTVLTSLDSDALKLVGIDTSVEEEVERLARLAQEAGLDGVVASPREIALIRRACGRDFILVTPGVRPAETAKHDQRRVMTPGEALQAGADYLVIGRPIRLARDPVEAVERIVEEMEGV
ncbi:MAG: orotidine-5'-phosphate decarboxylase [Deltaproteobacteria bacterium]|nr:orotidine-5'-phosphate decarboxylase [Deltaproteobacteria bacterium]